MATRTRIGVVLLTAMLALPLGVFADDDWTDEGYSGWTGPGMGMDMDGMMGHHGGGMGPEMHEHWMHALSRLDLTDQQQKQIQQIRDKLRKDHWQIEGKMLDAQAQMRDTLMVDTPDPKKVGAAYEAMAKLKRDIIETDVTALNQIKQLLTDEQREKLKRSFRGMMPGPMHGGMMPGPMHDGMMH